MTTASRPPVPIAIGSGGTGAEEARAFFQTRLALFGRWIFLISSAFLVVLTGMRFKIGLPIEPATWLHLLSTLLAGAVWAVGARSRASMPVMQAVEAVLTVLICVTFALMGVAISRSVLTMALSPASIVYVVLLATGYTLMARAIALPSTATRTMWVGAAVMLPLVASDFVIIMSAQLPAQARAIAIVDAISWKAAAVAMSSIASRVIFGLRAEVRQIRRLGQYTLEEKIGEGGMGIVYRARHAMLKRPTAVKLLPPDRAGEENIVRFEREVQLTAGLSHPNTVAIFDYGRTMEGVFYYAMEYLDGINLDQLVELDGPQPAPRVAEIIRQVTGALAEAHEIGLVHRDIKPANIILCERGGVPDVAKVVDFGLVKHFNPSNTAETMAVTAATTVVGTPLYMPPESVTGDGSVDARGDLYGLGAVAYLLVTGTPVFKARTAVEMYAHHLHTTPEAPSVRLGRQVPEDFERLILQCLAKSPADRPQSARALNRRLSEIVLGSEWTDADATAWWSRYRGTRQTAALP